MGNALRACREYRRVHLDELGKWLAQGWRPAVHRDGVVGATHYAAGTAVVLIMRDASAMRAHKARAWAPWAEPWTR